MTLRKIARAPVSVCALAGVNRVAVAALADAGHLVQILLIHIGGVVVAALDQLDVALGAGIGREAALIQVIGVAVTARAHLDDVLVTDLQRVAIVLVAALAHVERVLVTVLVCVDDAVVIALSLIHI